MVLVALCLLTPAAARAQARWDVTGVAGLFAGRAPEDDGRLYQDRWFQAAQGGAILGRMLSSHLRLEIETTQTTSGERHVSRTVEVPGLTVPYWVSSEVAESVGALGVSLGWQFGENDWVHPFVLAGVTADRDHRETRTPPQSYYPSDPRTTAQPILVAEGRTVSSIAWHARGVLAGGAKFYVRERAFIRVDSRLALDARRGHVMFRCGVGVEF